jgi:hypothetical protein
MKKATRQESRPRTHVGLMKRVVKNDPFQMGRQEKKEKDRSTKETNKEA